MADDTKIEWTDATVNFWWGCTKVGPGCDGCYAEAWDRRAGGAHWGQGVPRRKIKSAVQTLHRLDNGYSWWAADHAIGKINPTLRRRVFLQSMSDLFDIEVPLEWFREAWETIEACDRLALQILTKRISAVEKRLAAIERTEWPQHAGLMITVVNQPEAARDVPRLVALKERLRIPWVGLSCEPLLGLMDLTEWLHGLDWVIAGGESGGGARPMHPDWARGLRDQCQAAGVPFLFKQWGEWLPGSDIHYDARTTCMDRGGRRVHPPARVGDFPHGADSSDGWVWMRRVGKKRAGRLLDGQVWDQIPATHQEGANR